jgi:DNA-binding transcriptional LysR family regulator
VRRLDRVVSGHLTLGFCPGAALELTLPIVEAFRRAFPDVELEMREFPIADPSAGLNAGTVDVALIRLPQRTQSFATESLFTDPTIVAVPQNHPFAARGSVSLDDLAGQTLTLSTTADDEYEDYWGLKGSRGGAGPRFVPVQSITEEQSLVAAGTAIALTSSAVPTFNPMPGVRYLYVTDLPGSTVALGWHPHDRSDLVAEFVATARTVRDREQDLVAMMENRRLPTAASG